MINSIVEAISCSLNKEFGDDYEIHNEEIKQGLKEPCFFIACLNPNNNLCFILTAIHAELQRTRCST